MTGGTWLRRCQPIGEEECVHSSRVAACEMTWKQRQQNPPPPPLFFIIKLHQMPLYDDNYAAGCWRCFHFYCQRSCFAWFCSCVHRFTWYKCNVDVHVMLICVFDFLGRKERRLIQLLDWWGLMKMSVKMRVPAANASLSSLLLKITNIKQPYDPELSRNTVSDPQSKPDPSERNASFSNFKGIYWHLPLCQFNQPLHRVTHIHTSDIDAVPSKRWIGNILAPVNCY